jgi:hypothetical protein
MRIFYAEQEEPKDERVQWLLNSVASAVAGLVAQHEHFEFA